MFISIFIILMKQIKQLRQHIDIAIVKYNNGRTSTFF